MGTPESVSASRRLPNWLDSWLEYTAGLNSPLLFRKWAGISLLAASLERRVWIRSKGSDLYPNLYTILVGPPGTGKSAILSLTERTLRKLADLHIAPSSMTTASMVDTLAGAQRKIIRPQSTPNFAQFNSLQIVASELGVFLPAYDPSFMNTLNKLYDGEGYEERRRTGTVKHLKIDDGLLSVLGGTTPSYLNSFLPDGAWDQGFTSRTIFVFSAEASTVPIFSEEEETDHLEHIYIALLADLKQIVALFGKINWTKEAATAITAWNEAGLPPVPEHGKLTHYNTRRLAHCLKLCIVASIARSSDLQITLADYQTALDWLLEVEAFIPDIFKSMGTSADARAMEDCWYYVYQYYSKTKKPVFENVIIDFLRNRVASYQITKMVEIMVKSHLLKFTMVNNMPAYLPGEKRSAL